MNKKEICTLFAFLFFCLFLQADTLKQPTIYLIPGQGADDRLFEKLTLEEGYEVRHIKYELPGADMTLAEYAQQLAQQIDTCSPFILIGASLGGMLATEMREFLQAEKVIIIASAKSNQELPGRYRFQKKLPLYRLFPAKISKWGALILQPIFEPDRNKEKDTFVQMLKDKDPRFLQRTIRMIIQWERTTYDQGIIHIHGEKDHTIPIKNVDYDYLIENGSHVMTLTRAAELSDLINDLLKQ